MIRVVNKYNDERKDDELFINIMRGSPLGNPFYMNDKSIEARNRVCDLYEQWILEKIKYSSPQQEEIKRIVSLSNKHNIGLKCCCKPLRCHGDTLKKLIENIIKEGKWTI